MFISFKLFANDGAFFARGNQLIPIQETSISVKKEILSIKKIRNQLVEVSVYYEFFNPGPDKEIIVGFEAGAPEGDVEGAPKNGRHPYMRDFSVNINNKIIPYEIAYVSDSLYHQNGKIKSIDLKTFEGNKSGNYIDFFYVYHFKAKFKKGINIIKHTYNYDLSGSVDYHYDFEYILTAANRWANKQIDDFTLILDMGEFETFSINKSFFKNSNEWMINGIGKTEDIKGSPNSFIEKDALKFHLQKGSLVFQKKNFSPKGELYLYSVNYLMNGNEFFDYKDAYLPFSYYMQENIQQPSPASDLNKRILKNLPFARRGYIFKDAQLQQYFETLDWYIPNPNYEPNIEIFNEIEKSWVEKWK